MARWPNGGPKKVYIIIDNETADLRAFSQARRRKWWIEENPGDYTLLIYIQE